jgi:signal transduction histidine kinase
VQPRKRLKKSTPAPARGRRRRTEEEQAALFEIAKDIGGTLDLSAVLDRVQQRIAGLLSCDRVITYYWDTARSVYRALAWYGIPADFVPDTIALEFHSGQPVVERLLAGKTVLINDIAKQSWIPTDILAHFQLTRVLLVPLVVRGRRMGALTTLNAESGRRFDAHQVRLLEGIAQQVGVAIEAAELYRAQEEEAVVSGALARVGQELIAVLSSPALLDRLCQLTTEVLGCDHSHTWLWQPREDVFVPVAGYGDAPEQWEIIRLVKIGRSALGPQLEGMEREGIFNTKISELPGSEATAGALAYGKTAGLMVPLRRGSELLGFHTAGYCGGEGAFGARQERIARGVGQLASLAFENVRLVEELEQANKVKSDFVATMSHELRTPLNVIIGYTDLVVEGTFGPLTPEQAESLQRVQANARELRDLVTATLDVSRLEAGHVPLELQEVAIADLIREVDVETRELQEQPGLDFVWNVAADVPCMQTDPAKLRVVLKNLIGNAAKFTGRGTITVDARASDGGVEISVADTGIGISAEALPVIFEPFRQVDSSPTREHGGVGLGLYIVRRLLDLLGGTIAVESEVGRGSTFRVQLPLSTITRRRINLP